ncbi:cyclase family protein [bacterium]|nr:cyclase family protein [bacterium]
MTPEVVVEAAGAIRSGRVFALNLPINIPDPPLFTRGKHNHVIKQYASYILDDYLDNFYPQASSQWDALCHVKHPKFGAYNGIPDAEVTGYGGVKLGIDNLARRGIAGRGILADIGRYHERTGRTIDFTTNDMIPFEDLQATLAGQKTEIRPGDVLLVRIGWTKAYLAMSPEEKAELAAKTRCPGIEGTPRVAQWLWDNRIAAAASDSPALEAMPPPRTADFLESNDLLHFHMLSFFGMPIGEMWNLEELAEDCARDGRYEFFFTSAPLNIPGGVGSPPNALAIK